MRQRRLKVWMSKDIAISMILLLLFMIARNPTDATEGENFVVKITGFKFEPESVKTTAAGLITWSNQDIVPHTATAIDHSWSTGELLNLEQATLRVNDLTTLDYFCEYHPEMRGKLILGP